MFDWVSVIILDMMLVTNSIVNVHQLGGGRGRRGTITMSRHILECISNALRHEGIGTF